MMKRSHTISVAIAALLLAAPVLAQHQHTNQARGFNANGAFSSFDVDSINLFNGNLVVSIPIGQSYPVNGGLSYGLKLVYNSNIWTQTEVCPDLDGGVSTNYDLFTIWGHGRRLANPTGPGGSTQWVVSFERFIPSADGESPAVVDRSTESRCQTANHPNPATNAGLGWQLSLGKIYLPRRDWTQVYPAATEKLQIVYQSPDGSEHQFYGKLHEDDDEDGDPGNGVTDVANLYYTRDGSYLRMRSAPAPGYSYLIEFPTGEKHFFRTVLVENATSYSLAQYEEKLARIEDQFGNWVNVAYRDDDADADTLADNVWEITDSVGRSHAVRLGKIGRISVVQSVTLDAYGNGVNQNLNAVYNFTYETRNIFLPTPHAPQGFIPGYNTGGDDQIAGHFLTALQLPDGSHYSMPVDTSYEIGLPQSRVPGVLRGMTLPTGGRIQWDYEVTDPSDPLYGNTTYGYYYPNGSSGRHYSRYSVGVRRRAVIEGPRRHLWKYDPKIGAFPPQGSYCTPSSSGEPCGQMDLVNTVTTPEGDYTVNYFSVYPFPQGSGSEAGRAAADPHVADYGLPLTKDPSVPRVTDVGGQPLFLSAEVYSAGRVLKRRTYVRYETDTFTRSDGYGNVVETNARLAASRTVYHDDGEKYAETQHGDFDGLGHFRQTNIYSNFAPGSERQETTGYNPSRGRYYIDPATNQRGPGHTYTPFPQDKPWVLGNYDTKSATEAPQRSTAYFNFNDRGQLLGKRTLKNIESSAATTLGLNAQDVLVTYGYSAAGNVASESHYGGDKRGGLSTTSKFAVPAASEYIVDFGYQCAGGPYTTSEPSSSQFRGANYKLLDNDVDCRTGLVVSARDVAGNETSYDYDNMSRLTHIKRQQGSYTQVDYTVVLGGSRAGSPSVRLYSRANGSLSGAALEEKEYVYDQLGRLTREREKLANGTFRSRDTTYNGLGWRTSVSEWGNGQSNAGKKTVFSNFDPFGRPWQTTAADGKVSKNQHSGVRQVTRITRVGTSVSAGVVSESDATAIERYDQLGRLAEVVEASGPNGQPVTTTYRYDVGNRLVQVDTSAPAGSVTVRQVRTFTYDNLGNLRSEAHPERALTQYDGYDTKGNVGSQYDGAHRLRYAYDTANRIVSVEEQNGAAYRRLKEFTYWDANGTQSGVNADGTPNGGAFALSKLATATRHNYVINPYAPGSTAEIDVPVTEQYTYSGLDGALSKRVTATGRGPAFEQTFVYDQLGDLTSQTYPKCKHSTCAVVGTARAWRVNYTRVNGWMSSINGGVVGSTPSSTYLSSTAYHPNGMISTLVHGNNVSDLHGMDPDSMMRPASIATSGVVGSPNWGTSTYGYDGAGNITKIGANWYVYDKVSRLVEGTAMAAPKKKQTYSYDPFGNFLSIDTYDNVTTTGANLTGRYAPGVNSARNQLNGVAYDAAGNTLGVNATQQYFYDALNMIRYAPGLTYIYGPDDERLSVVDRHDPTFVVETYTLRGLDNEPLREYVMSGSDAAGNWKWQKDYIYRDSQLLASESPAGTQHYHLDHLGSPRVITDSSAQAVQRPQYFPFGEEATAPAAPGERLKYTGHERDLDYSGQTLDYMHARFFRPAAGKFLSVDPARDSNPQRPQSWNLYAYARNNPMNSADPAGTVDTRSQLQKSYDAIFAPISPLDAVVEAAPRALRAAARKHVPFVLEAARAEGLSREQLAAVLATMQVESNMGQNVYELYNGNPVQYFENKYGHQTAKGKNELGNVNPGDGYNFRGTGYAHLTGRRQFEKASRYTGLDLVNNPWFAADPRVAARVIVIGSLYGQFTGHGLGRYVNDTKTDFVGSRRVINGTDRASQVAGYAQRYLNALNRSNW